jgi:predicted membrane protein
VTTRSSWQIIIGAVIVLIGLVALANNLGWTSITAGQIIGVLFALALIVLGFWLIRNTYRSARTPSGINRVLGDINVGRGRWQLRRLDIQSGVGDIHIDLNHADIPDREGYVDISSVIGDVEVLVPIGLEARVHGAAWLGDLRVFGRKESGFVREVAITTEHFETAEKRVVIDARLGIGDILITRVE